MWTPERTSGKVVARLGLLVLALLCLLLSGCPKERQRGPVKVTWDWDGDHLWYKIQLDKNTEYLAEMSMPAFSGPGITRLDVDNARWRITESAQGWLGATRKAEQVAALYSVFWELGNFREAAVGQLNEVALLKTFEEVTEAGINPADSMGVVRGFASMVDTVTKSYIKYITGLRGIPIASGDVIEVKVPARMAFEGKYRPDPMDRFSIRFVLTNMSAFSRQMVKASYRIKGLDKGGEDHGWIKVERLFAETQKGPRPYRFIPSAFWAGTKYEAYYFLMHPGKLQTGQRVYKTEPPLEKVLASGNVTRTAEIADFIDPDAKRRSKDTPGSGTGPPPPPPSKTSNWLFVTIRDADAPMVVLLSGAKVEVYHHLPKTLDIPEEDRSAAGRPEFMRKYYKLLASSSTDSYGMCHFRNLAAGPYHLVVSHTGYQTRVVRDIDTKKEQTVRVALSRLEQVPDGPSTESTGTLDLVFCIDKSGSMIDDIQALQGAADVTLEALGSFAKAKRFSLRVGLVTYTRHDEKDWIQAHALSSNVETIRGYIRDIKIAGVGVGASGNEDLYGAMMYAMNQTVGGERIHMGWRPGAAKIIIPMGDEPPDDPDWEKRTLSDVARVAKNLDPVHIYPMLMPKRGLEFLTGANSAMKRIARATGGEVVRVNKAAALPQALVATVKLAVRRHRNEVWRKENPPYFLYGTLAVILVIIVLTPLGLLIRSLASRGQRQ